MSIRVKIAGVGGQGIQFAGKLLGHSAFSSDLNVSQAVKYEPSTKGGLTVADITIAKRDEEIVYPFIEEEPDILVIFAQRCWEEFSGIIGENTIVLVDDSNVDTSNSTHAKIYRLPFSKIAREDIGSENVMNVVALGFISELLDIEGNHIAKSINQSSPEDAEDHTLLEITPELFEESLIHDSPPKFREMNLNAFRKGYELSASMEIRK